MRASVVRIGNSRGIRIPKPLLEEAGIEQEVDLSVRGGVLRVVPVKAPTKIGETALMSEAALASDWNREEEDLAWQSLR